METIKLKDIELSTEMMNANQISSQTILNSEFSGAIGGGYAYHMTNFDFSNKKITIETDVSGIKTGYWYSVQFSNNFDLVGKVTNVDVESKTITVDAVPTGDYAIWDPSKTNHIWFPEHPEIGNIFIGKMAQVIGDNCKATQQYSFAQGQKTYASGKRSHAEGMNTYAGYASHSEGSNTYAHGRASHSEGTNNHAYGDASHVEGQDNNVYGNQSHAEGHNTKCYGTGSHSEGMNTLVSADYAHSEGSNVSALGQCSHAEGSSVEARGNYSHSEGYSTTTESTAIYSHAEGGGSKTYGIGSHAEGAGSNAYGESSHAEGSQSKSYGYGSHTEGRNGQTLSCDMSSWSVGGLTPCDGECAHAEGWDTRAYGRGSHAEGGSTIAYGTQSHAEGNNTVAYGGHSHVDGTDCFVSSDISYVWSGKRWESYSDIHNGEMLSGSYNINPVNGINGFFIGNKSLSVALDEIYPNRTKEFFCAGKDADVSDQFGTNRNVAIGLSATVYDDPSNPENRQGVAIGRKAKASSAATVVGPQAGNPNLGPQAVAIGYKAGKTSTGKGSVSIGEGANANGDQHAIAIGRDAATENCGIAIGWQTSCLNGDGIAIGSNTKTKTTNSIALGDWAVASASYCVQIFGENGDEIVNDQEKSIHFLDSIIYEKAIHNDEESIYRNSRLLGTDVSFSIGNGSKAGLYGNQIAIGSNAQTNSNYATAIGSDLLVNGEYTIALSRNLSTYNSHSIFIGENLSAKSSIQNVLNIGKDNVDNGRNGNILIGHSLSTESDCHACLVVGTNSTIGEETMYGIAIGCNALVGSRASNAAQIGWGTNNNADTLQFRNTTIVNSNGKINSLSLDFNGFVGFLNSLDTTQKSQIRQALGM